MEENAGDLVARGGPLDTHKPGLEHCRGTVERKRKMAMDALLGHGRHCPCMDCFWGYTMFLYTEKITRQYMNVNYDVFKTGKV